MTRKKPRKSRTQRRSLPVEDHAIEVMTIAWTVSVMAVLLCDLAAMGVYVAAWVGLEFPWMNLLKTMFIFSGSLIGLVSLALLPLVLRMRRLPPPTSIVVFAVLVASAPLLVLLGRILR